MILVFHKNFLRRQLLWLRIRASLHIQDKSMQLKEKELPHSGGRSSSRCRCSVKV